MKQAITYLPQTERGYVLPLCAHLGGLGRG